MAAACCFVCDGAVTGSGVSLLVGRTLHSHTDLPTKIGQLLGEEFLVVVQTEDVLCRSCERLLNHLDRLEVQVVVLKDRLAAFLHAKYRLDDSPQPSRESADVASEMYGNARYDYLDDTDSKNCQTSVSYEAIQCEDKVNVEIILEKQERSASTRPSTQGSLACSMCDQSFSSNKRIQRHVMQQHLSTWVCHFCDAKFSEEREYTCHLGTHLTHSTSHSSLCQDGPTTAVSAHGVRRYECGICAHRATSKQSLDEHVRSHVVLKLFKCEECGKRFRNQELLMKHLQTCCLQSSVGSPSGEVTFENGSDVADRVKSRSTVRNKCAADDEAVLEIFGVHDSYDKLVDDENENDVVENIKNSELDTQSSSRVDVFQCRICFEVFESKLLHDEHVKVHGTTLSPPPKNVDLSVTASNDKENVVNHVQASVKIKCDTKNGELEEMLNKVNSDKKHTTEIDNKCQQEKLENDEQHFENNYIFKSGQCTVSNASIQIMSLLNSDSSQIYEDQLMQSLENLNVGNACIDDNGLINIISCEGGENPTEPLNRIQYVFNMVNGENIAVVDSEETSDDVPAGQFKNQPKSLELGVKDLDDNIPSLGEVQKKAYLCAVCGHRSPDLVDLKTHFKIHKNIKSHSSHTRETFSPKKKIALNFRSEKDSTKLMCLHCFGKFDDRQTLNQHIADNHPVEQYCCGACDQRFASRKALKLHKDSHPDKLFYKCDSCNQRFSRVKQMKHHKDTIHRDPHCRYCGKEILKARTLKNHELRHAREACSFECDICKRVFKTKTGLRHHVATHTGEYKFCCDYCGRGFMSRMMMEEHRSMHTKEERYVCDVCGRKFSFQSTYWIHRKWHDTPYPYKCGYCGRLFRHSSLLAVHKRKHTGERPYKCPQCPLTFPVGGTLKRHMILHTGAYPFNCDRCKRGFTTKHKYATHLAKVHSDYDLLDSKPPRSDFKMVVREEPGVLDSEPHGMLADDVVPTRVVEIVLDEGSQAMATVTLAEHGTVMSDLWYQQ